MSDRLRAALERDFGDQYRGTLTVARSASVGFSRVTYLWMGVGVLAGFFLLIAFDLGSPGLVGAVGGVTGMIIGFALQDRLARHDHSQPGGFAVAIGLTESELVVFDRPIWSLTGSILGVAGSTPLGTLVRVLDEKANLFGGHRITFEWQNGTNWSFEIPRWEPLRKALPDEALNF